MAFKQCSNQQRTDKKNKKADDIYFVSGYHWRGEGYDKEEAYKSS